MPFGLIGDVVGAVFGGGGDSEAEANNDVDVSVTSSPIINIELDDLSESIDGVSAGIDEGIRSFSSTTAFVALIGIAALVFMRGPP